MTEQSDQGAPQGTDEARRQELEHLLAAGVVRERSQMHNLLRYLGEKSLQAANQPLKEYTIGVDALHKPEDYDPRVDPTVRVEVARLRKKLDEYYRKAGSDRSWRMLIPKGGYLPEWSAAQAREESAGLRHAPRMFAFVAVAAVAGTMGWTLFDGTNPARSDRDFQLFWGPILDRKAPTLLVYGTRLFVKVEGNYFRDTHLNRAEDVSTSEPVRDVIRALEPKEVRPVYAFTGLGEADAVFLVTRALSSRGVALSLKRSNTTAWDDLRHTHVVLIGGPKYIPQMKDLPYEPKYQATNRGIVNLRPQGSETPLYPTERRTSHGEIVEEHSLISVYPGLDGQTRIIVLESHSTEGTLAGAEFITRPETLRELAERMSLASTPARAFQIVIQSRINGGIVVKLSYVTHVILG